MTKSKKNRREFLHDAARGVAAASLALPLVSQPATGHGHMPYRTLGRTGEKVSLLGMGGWPLGDRMSSAEQSTRFVRTAIDSGINYLESSWDYQFGLSEERLGKALRDGYRKQVFLATKINGRSKEVADFQPEDSLRRLRTDCIDLIQFHEVLYPHEPDKIFGPNRVLKKALEHVIVSGANDLSSLSPFDEEMLRSRSA